MAKEDEPYIHISPAATDEQKQNLAPLLDFCPTCGAATEFGYGLAGGGMGVYVYCPTDGCDYFAKHQMEK